MPINSWQIESPGPRDWPTLRDLVVRAADGRQCRDLLEAVSESAHPAQAWKERMTGMVGRGRLALFLRDEDDRRQAFVSAYVDGDGEERYVVVRHLLVVPRSHQRAGAAAWDLLLDQVETWARRQDSGEVLLEISRGDRAAATILERRGYRLSGAARPAFDADDPDVAVTGRMVTEWSRVLRGTDHGFRRRGPVAVAS